MVRPANAADAATLSAHAGASEARAATAPADGPAAGSVDGPVAGPAAGESPVEDGALYAPLALASPIVRSEAVALRPPLSHGAGLILAGARARLQALRDAAEALPNRRDIRMGAVNAEERLALAAHLYTAVGRHKPADAPHPADNGSARAEVSLEARPAAAAGMSQILHSFDLMQMRLHLLRESTALLQLMNSRHVSGTALGTTLAETSGAAPGETGETAETSGAAPGATMPYASAHPSGPAGADFGRSVFRAPVRLPGEGDHEEPRGNARKNALDEFFSGRAGAGMGPHPVQAVPPGSVASANDAPQFAPHVPAPRPDLSDEVWTQNHWGLAARRLQAMFDVQDMLADADADGWLVRAGDLPQLEQAAQLVPHSPSVWLLLAEAQMRHDLPLQSVASCDAALALDFGQSRARYIRALGHLRLQQLALAEADLTVSLARRNGVQPQGEDRARRLRTRGAVRMQRHDTAGMCEDFGAACALGDCEGLMLVRAQGQCLPPAVEEAQKKPPPAASEDSSAAGLAASPAPHKTETPLPGSKEKRE